MDDFLPTFCDMAYFLVCINIHSPIHFPPKLLQFLEKSRFSMYNKILSKLFFLMTMIIMVSSCRPDPSGGDAVIVVVEEYGAEEQRKIGDVLNEVISDPANGFNMLDPNEYPEVYLHLNTILGMIVNTQPVNRRTDFEWKVSVLEDDNMETAFMTPGGHLYMFTGLLKYLDGEHELIGVMAHELGYADNDNLIDRIANEFGNRDLSSILSDVIESDQIAMDMANDIIDMQFSPNEVTASDEFAMSIVCEFGWDAAGLSHLLSRAESDSPQVEWIDRKPIFETRIEAINDLIGNGVDFYCGTPNNTYQDRYMERIINRLP